MYDNEFANEYGVAPIAPLTMQETNYHESGNALAANSEARAVSEVKAQVIMARQYPRNVLTAHDRIMQECQRPSLAEKAVYSFPRGRETVSGPSIRLAEVLARNWGNCTFGYEVLDRKESLNDRTPGSSIIRAYAWDMETNTYISRQFEVKHWRQTQKGGYALKEDRDIYELEANMASRRMRACILQMIPGDITQNAVNACRMTEASGLSDKMKNPRERENLIAKTLQLYEKMGVKLEDLEDMLKTKKDDWKADHMLKLKEAMNAIRDNVQTIGDFFPRLSTFEKSDKISKDQTQTLMAEAKKTGKQSEISDELRKRGIAKFADVTADQYEEILAFVKSFADSTAEMLTAPVEA